MRIAAHPDSPPRATDSVRGPGVERTAILSLMRSCAVSIALAVGCNVVPATQVIVEFQADEETIGRAAEMMVTVFDVAGAPVEPPLTRAVGSDAGEVAFPTAVPVEPLGGDASRRFRIVGVLRDRAGRTVARGETTEGFVAGERRTVIVTLDPRCAPPPPALPPLPEARRFFVGPAGDDAASGGTREEAWATFARAVSALEPGDTLVILDATYQEPLRVDRSGTQDAPITIAAETDGGVTIDGRAIASPCRVGGEAGARVSFVELRGLVCENGPARGYGSVYLHDVDHVSVRRVSAYGPGGYGTVTVLRGSEVLLEDVVASGEAGALVFVAQATDSTIRRCFASRPGSRSEYTVGVQLHSGVERVIVENCVATREGDASLMSGFHVRTPDHEAPANDNLFAGDIARDVVSHGFFVSAELTTIRGTRIEGSISLRNDYGLFQRGDAALVVDSSTWLGRPDSGSDQGHHTFPNGVMPTDVRDPDFAINADVRNTMLADLDVGLRIGSMEVPITLVQRFNDFFGVTTPYAGGVAMGEGESMTDPGYDVERFGDGAYLMGAPALRGRGEGGRDIGATILHRLEDGATTDVPLWPWPMEDRIERELGVSVTYAARGGLFTTLCDVYPP